MKTKRKRDNRVHVAVRLPRELVEWMDTHATATRTAVVEGALSYAKKRGVVVLGVSVVEP